MDGYFGGFISGIAQTIIGHPIDTLKTWIQNSNIKRPTMTIANIVKGIQYPMVQLPLVSSVSFGLYDNIYSVTEDRIISGTASGFMRTPIITPLEYYKINLQQQLIPIWQNSYKNILPVTLKEVPSATIYYGTYHYLKEKKVSILLSGSLAGVASWVSIYPLDTITTRLQTGTAINIKHAMA